MPRILSRYATPLLTGLFVVSLVSGVALFFHIGMVWFHGMHEWLSMVLVLPLGMYLWKNWKPFLTYFRRTPMAIALGVVVIAAVPFVLPAPGNEPPGNPMVSLLRIVQASPLETVAPLFGYSRDTFVAVLERNGYSVPSRAETLSAVAAANGKTDRDIIGVLATLR